MENIKHFVDTADFTKDELLDLLDITMLLKEAEEKGVRLPLLKDMSLGMMFDQPSTRTRISFETAMTQLGGHALYLESKTMHVGEELETVKETAKVISSMCDAILIRTYEHKTVLQMAQYSSVPVINGMSIDALHPTQVVADVLTMLEHKPRDKKLEDLVFMFIGDTTSKPIVEDGCIEPVFRSHCRILSQLGMTVIACSPKGYTIDAEEEKWIRERMEKSGGKLIITDDPHAYIGQVDFLYTGATVYHDDGYTKEEAFRIFYPKYQINKELMELAQPHCKVMHYLPGNRDYEITSEVWDGEQSILLPQAENRLHAEKGILAWLLYERRKIASDRLKDYYMGKAEDLLTHRKPNQFR